MSAKKGAKKESSKKEVVEPSYQLKDVVLGKVKGYRAWPGFIVDPENVPPAVRKERPSGKKSTYVVQFFPVGDYAWLTSKDISKLQKHEIESFLADSSQSKPDLVAGYKAALNPDEWLETRQNEEFNGEEEEEPVDELASGDEENGKSSKSKKRASSAAGGGKKRKREEASSTGGEKGGKKKESVSATGGKKGAKGGKKGGKSKAMVESEDEGAGDDDEDGRAISKKASPPPTKKSKKDDGEDTADPEALKVREWRHKLQKIFLSNKSPAKLSEMPAMDNLFRTIEDYDKMDVGYLSFSKIGKVMRHIAALTDDKVPNDDEYRFRERAKKLVDQWHTIVGPTKEKEVNGTNGSNTNGNYPNGDTGELSMLGDMTMDTDAGGEL